MSKRMCLEAHPASSNPSHHEGETVNFIELDPAIRCLLRPMLWVSTPPPHVWERIKSHILTMRAPLTHSSAGRCIL
jgi:hypothetical protein